ncbi:MAG TPA: PIG-L family deacetylase [Bacteroidota bacterium]|nr:PIG-L family deacetylase [Bacteroidota bacterium]
MPVPAHSSPPAAAAGARHQAMLDLASATVVMSVAAEPGGEDLPTLAALRLGSGARVVSMYVTNGGATPSDIDGDLPLQVAATRKIESERVVRNLGGEAVFLGFPDYGFVDRTPDLERLWNRDSLLDRMTLVIRRYRPDVILIESDPRTGSGDTVRSSLIRECVLKSARLSGGPHQGAQGEPGSWAVSRIFEETDLPGTALSAGVDNMDPVLKKSYRSIAAAAGRSYRSLRYQLEEWNAGRKGTYRYIVPEPGRSRGLIDGVPALPASIRDAALDVSQAASDAEKGPDETALRSISRAIARVENSIAVRRAELTGLEKRVLVAWKDKLEDLRCAILGIDVRFIVSDSMIARRQQFTLRFPKDRRFPLTGRSEIIFPDAMDSTWLINRSEGFRFSFTVPDTFEIVTPEIMEYNRPVSTNGSQDLLLNTRIPFIIVHRDTDPLKNFACRREIVMGVSPVQSAEILTPFVRVTPGEQLIVRLLNVSRQPYRGMMSVGDSVARGSRKLLTISRADNERREALPLSWRDSVPDGDHIVALHIGKGKPVGTFTARKFEAIADTTRPVGLFTGLKETPVEDALRRLHIPCIRIDGSFGDTTAAEMRTVIIDRDAFALHPDGKRVAPAIEAWVRSGGHCVMLRQHPASPAAGILAGYAGFGRSPVIAPEATVVADGAIARQPNALSEGDWRGWIISRAQSPLVLSRDSNPLVSLRDASTGAPLIASVALGKGTLTAVALDLLPQFQIVHPGACRLLANLVSY